MGGYKHRPCLNPTIAIIRRNPLNPEILLEVLSFQDPQQVMGTCESQTMRLATFCFGGFQKSGSLYRGICGVRRGYLGRERERDIYIYTCIYRGFGVQSSQN